MHPGIYETSAVVCSPANQPRQKLALSRAACKSHHISEAARMGSHRSFGYKPLLAVPSVPTTCQWRQVTPCLAFQYLLSTSGTPQSLLSWCLQHACLSYHRNLQLASIQITIAEDRDIGRTRVPYCLDLQPHFGTIIDVD
jgi:hypothetical protein